MLLSLPLMPVDRVRIPGSLRGGEEADLARAQLVVEATNLRLAYQQSQTRGERPAEY